MKFPNLFIAGFPKCGTTVTAWTLHKLNAARLPDIDIENLSTWECCQKEPAFMQRSEKERIELCEKCYGEERYRLDATASYIHHKSALKNIGELGAKVIILMRNPVYRVISWWNHHQRMMIEGDLKNHWRLPRGLTLENLITDILTSEVDQDTILTGGDYPERIKLLLKYVDRKNIHFDFLEDLAENPEAYYARIFDFLDVEQPKAIDVDVPMNKGLGLTVPKEIVRTLQRYYIESIKGTEKIVGRIPASWKQQ